MFAYACVNVDLKCCFFSLEFHLGLLALASFCHKCSVNYERLSFFFCISSELLFQ